MECEIGGARGIRRQRPGGSWIETLTMELTRSTGTSDRSRGIGVDAIEMPKSPKAVADASASKTKDFVSFDE